MISSVKKQFIKNIFSGWFAQLSATVVGVVMLPYNLHHLGKDLYAIHVLAVSLVAMLQWINLGMGPALLRFFAQAMAQNDLREIGRLSSTAQVVLGSLGLFGAGLLTLAIPVFLRVYEVLPEFHRDTTILMVLMAGTFFLNFHNIVFTNMILANQRYDLVKLRQVVSHWLQLGLLVALYNVFTPSLIWLGTALFAGTLYQYAATVFLCRSRWGRVVFFSRKNVAFGRLPEFFSFSLLTLINSTFFSLSIQVPLLIIGKTLGKESVALLAPAVLISTFLCSTLAHLCDSLTPLAAKDHAINGGKNLGRWALLFGQIVACCSYACLFGAVLFMPDVLRLWLGEDFVAISNVVTIFAAGAVFGSIQLATNNLALGAGSMAPFAFSSVVMALAIILGVFIGTAFLHWGLLGVVTSMACIRIIRNTFYITWKYSQPFGYSLRNYFAGVYGKPLLGGLTAFAFILLVRPWLPEPHGLVTTAGEIAAYGVVYALGTWFLGISPETKNVILSIRR